MEDQTTAKIAPNRRRAQPNAFEAAVGVRTTTTVTTTSLTAPYQSDNTQDPPPDPGATTCEYSEEENEGDFTDEPSGRWHRLSDGVSWHEYMAWLRPARRVLDKLSRKHNLSQDVFTYLMLFVDPTAKVNQYAAQAKRNLLLLWRPSWGWSLKKKRRMRHRQHQRSLKRLPEGDVVDDAEEVELPKWAREMPPETRKERARRQRRRADALKYDPARYGPQGPQLARRSGQGKRKSP